jgi:hypothetical protein
VLAEFRGKLRAESFRPVTAYRAAELVDEGDPLFAQALYEVAGAAGGRLGLKALLRAAQRLSVRAPERARELLDRARDLAPDAEAQAQVEKLRAALPPPPRTQISVDLSPEGEPPRELRCHLAAVHGPTLDLVRPDGRTARLEPARVAQVSAAALDRLTWNGLERRNGAVLDLLLHPGADGRQALLRLALHELPLARHFPGQPPAAAFAELVEALRTAAGATAWPDLAGAQGRPFARFPDLRSYECACYGRAVSGEG